VVFKTNSSFGVAAVVSVALVSGALFWFGTGLNPIWWITWLAPLPILFLSARVSGGVSFSAAFFAYALGALNEWHYGRDLLEMPLATVLLAVLTPALIFASAVAAWRFFLKRDRLWEAVLVFPSIWVAVEFALQRLSPHSTFGSIAYTQMDYLPVLQLASITGLLGISFLLLFTSGAIAVLTSPLTSRPRKRRVLGLSLATLLALLLSWGAWRLRNSASSASSIKIGLIASDVRQNLSPKTLEGKRQLFDEYAAQIAALSNQGARIVVLPEKIAKVDEQSVAELDAAFAKAGLGRTRIVVGVERWTTDAKLNESRIYDVDGKLEATFEKHHMLPWMEGYLLPGRSLTVLNLPAGRCGITICKDMDFPELSREYGNQGVALQLVSAWDFVADGWLHSRMAIMRGVESGFTLARAAKQGRLTISDTRGRILAEKGGDAAPFSTLLASAPVRHEATLYARWGDWFSWCNLALLATLLLFGARRHTITNVRRLNASTIPFAESRS